MKSGQRIILFFLSVALSGCRPEQAAPALILPPITDCKECSIDRPSTLEPVWKVTINGCAAEDSPQQNRSLSVGTEKDPELFLNDGTLHYTHAINHNCCMKITLEEDNIQPGVITITEKWEGKVCRCACFSEIAADLENLLPGVYSVKVVQKGDPDGLEPEKQVTLLESQIEVK